MFFGPLKYPHVHVAPLYKYQEEQHKMSSEEMPYYLLPATITQTHLILRM